MPSTPSLHTTGCHQLLASRPPPAINSAQGGTPGHLKLLVGASVAKNNSKIMGQPVPCYPVSCTEPCQLHAFLPYTRSQCSYAGQRCRAYSEHLNVAMQIIFGAWFGVVGSCVHVLDFGVQFYCAAQYEGHHVCMHADLCRASQTYIKENYR